MTSPHKDTALMNEITAKTRLQAATKYITNLKEANAFLASRSRHLVMTSYTDWLGETLYRAFSMDQLIHQSNDLQDALIMGVIKHAELTTESRPDQLAWFESNHDRKPNPEQSFVPSEQETAYAVAREKIACALTLLNDATALLVESQRLIEGKVP